jgi:photosystem I P700 chlorophyll a apoprotein A2
MVVHYRYAYKPRFIHRFCFLSFSFSSFLICRWRFIYNQTSNSLSWFKDAESRLNHHLSGLFGVSSLAWTGHLVHVAIPESRGQHVGWDNFLSLPHPQGLAPFWTGNWAAYAQNQIQQATISALVMVLVQLF